MKKNCAIKLFIYKERRNEQLIGHTQVLSGL